MSRQSLTVALPDRSDAGDHRSPQRSLKSLGRFFFREQAVL
jgi:hypothetical protein